MAGAGAGASPGTGDVGAPGEAGEAELVARVAALEHSLAGKEAEVGEKREVAEKAAAEHARAEAGAERERAEVAKAKDALAWYRRRRDPAWRDWAGGLPDEVLEKVIGTLAQTEAGWAAKLKKVKLKYWMNEEKILEEMAKRKHEGSCLFVFARVCREWRKAQLKVGGPLCTWVESDVIKPGRVALVKWALAEGCPEKDQNPPWSSMRNVAAEHGHLELVRWLCGEGGFAMNTSVMVMATRSGNLQLVQWLRGEGCPWNSSTCNHAVVLGHVEVLRWARENGCPWNDYTRDDAAAKLGYTDDFGNLVDYKDNPIDEDDEYGYH